MRLRARSAGSRFAPRRRRARRRARDGALDLDGCVEALDGFERELRRDRRLLARHGVVHRPPDRQRHARPRDASRTYGGVGPVARGSGVSTDARFERPYGDYRRLGFEVVTARRRRRDGAGRGPLRRDRASRCT